MHFPRHSWPSTKYRPRCIDTRVGRDGWSISHTSCLLCKFFAKLISIFTMGETLAFCKPLVAHLHRAAYVLIQFNRQLESIFDRDTIMLLHSCAVASV